MIYSALLASAPSAKRIQIKIAQGDKQAVRIWGIYMAVIAVSSIGTGDQGMMGLSLQDIPAADLGNTAIEFHNLQGDEAGSATQARSSHMFLTSPITGQNNMSPRDLRFRKGILLAGDFYLYTINDGGTGPSFIGSIIFEYELETVSVIRRAQLTKTVQD